MSLHKRNNHATQLLHQLFPLFQLSFDQVPRCVRGAIFLLVRAFVMQLLSIIILLTLTVVIHSLWMFGVLKFIKLEVDSAVRIVLRTVGIVISMIFAHLLEAGLFAAFYFVIDAFKDWNTSFYFSLVSYATVGYGDVTLPQHWRLIGGVEGLIGALMVGWSVAVLVAVLQRLRGMTA